MKPLSPLKISFYSCMALLCLFGAMACGGGNSNVTNDADSLTEEQLRFPANALQTLIVTEGLAVTQMAAEPMLKNPTNIDVDEKGRVWVCEAYNYRPGPGKTVTPGGDRIVILEDVNGDGLMDTSKVFYQGPEINAPLGVCVLGKEVIVSQSPYVWRFIDDNGDDRADRKEIMFQGIGGEQHDHGMHSFSFGPDGKLYFNFGNEGKTLLDKNGVVVKDQDGDPIGPAKYKQGMLFRCNPDGSRVECLGQNFRNNFEAAVDSYGTIWQSDNDDDGNKGTRINYVMEYGNYGFTDEMTGAAWSAPRTNIEDSIPLRHWHLNDPGVVPNLLQTGAGSPTGMVVYEGDLLPADFRNQLIHCEPGHNVVRSYIVAKEGAGYTAGIKNILQSGKDQWFRPADVCVAPDGSLIVADWYDAVVGGHDAQDQEKGRIYRIAPRGTAYTVPNYDYSSPSGAVQALQNANLAVRRKAWLSLRAMGDTAVAELEKLWRSGSPRMRARALWLLSTSRNGKQYILEAAKDSEPDIRITALRANTQLQRDDISIVSLLAGDPDPQVRRACAIALHHNTHPGAAGLWANLATRHNSKDRWYLEALGIGADGQWDHFFDAWLKLVPQPTQSREGRDITWRARTDKALPLLALLAVDSSESWEQRQRYFRAFDFHKGNQKTDVLLGMIAANTKQDARLNTLLLHHLSPGAINKSPLAKKALAQVVASTYGTNAYIELVQQYALSSEKPRLIELILDRPTEAVATEAVKLVLAYGGEQQLKTMVTGKDTSKSARVLTAYGDVGYEQTLNQLQQVLLSATYPTQLREVAALSLGRTYGGEHRVMDLVKAKKVPQQYIKLLMQGMTHGPRRSMYLKVEALLSDSAAARQTPFDAAAVLALNGDITRGKKIFSDNCAVCHQVKGEGADFGPRLSEIGSKLPKEGLLEAIANPSGGISFGFESWELQLKNRTTLMGIIASKTEQEIRLKYPGGNTETVPLANIKAMKKLPESIMPALHETMTHQQLADLLGFLSSLQNK